MKKIGVVTDSTADFPDGMEHHLGIHVVPIHVYVDGHDFRDGVDIVKSDLVEALKQGKNIETQPPTPSEYADAYEKMLGEYEHIVSFHISHHLSGCYQSAVSALKLLYGDDASRITVIDTGTLSIGQGLYLSRAMKIIRGGCPVSELASRLTGIMDRSVHNFTVETLKWLRKGGRVGMLGALFGNMLDIKPVIALKNESLVPVGRYRGKRAALDAMSEYAQKNHMEADNALEIWVAHADAQDDANYLADALSLATATPVEEIQVVEIGATIAAHAGPGCVGWGMVQKQDGNNMAA